MPSTRAQRAHVLALLAGFLLVTFLPLTPGQPSPESKAEAVYSAEIQAERYQEVRDALRAGKYDEAESTSRRYLAEATEEWGANSRQAAQFLDVLVLALMGNGKAREEETLVIARRALEIWESEPEATPDELAGALSGVGEVYRRRRGYEEATRWFSQAIEILREAGQMETVLVARLLNLQGICERRRGNLEVAKDLFEQSAQLHLVITEPDPSLRAAAIGNLANTHQRLGDLSTALVLHREALDIDERVNGPNHERTAMALANLSVALSEYGDLDEARRVAERALAITETSLRPDHPRIGYELVTLAIYTSRLGDADAALEYGLRALGIARNTDDLQVVRVLTHLGTFADRGDREDLATDYYDEALSVAESMESPNPKALSELYLLSGNLLLWQGHVEAGEGRLLEAVAWAEKDPNLRFAVRASAIRHLGILYVVKGDLGLAKQYLEEALSEYEFSLGNSHPHVAIARYYLGLAEHGLGDDEAAFASALASHDGQQQHLLGTIDALSETMALRYLARRMPALDLAISLILENPDPVRIEQVWDRVVGRRALVLDELARRHRLAASVDDSLLQEKLDRVRSARERLANRTMAGPGSSSPVEYLEKLETLGRARDRAERDLAEAELDRDVTRDLASAQRVREAIPSGAALVSFVRYDDHRDGQPDEAAYATFIARSGEASCQVVDLASAATIDGATASWWEQAALGGGQSRGFIRLKTTPEGQIEDYRAAGRELRRQVWDPLVPHLEGLEQVFLVPDGELHQVSFATLPNDDETYLLETGPLLHLLSAERTMLIGEDRARGGAEHGSGLLVMGNPAFDDTPEDPPRSVIEDVPSTTLIAAHVFRGPRSDDPDFASLSFGSLEGARREAQEVADIWSITPDLRETDVLYLTGSAASERAFKERAPGRDVLHLATHGFFLGHGGEEEPDLARVPPESTASPILLRSERAFIEESPLLLSGLAFAGANLRSQANLPHGQDGIATAEEIATMDLGGLQWAVLSACETGAGTTRSGEGVFGLRRAFEVAGARTVIMSLWAVDDEGTRAWMNALYRARFEDGLSTAEAVRQASLVRLRQARSAGESDHPFGWAGFVAAGDWR